MKTKEATKIALEFLLFSGAVIVAANNPRYARRFFSNVIRDYQKLRKCQKISNVKQLQDTFSYLKRRELIKVVYEGKQIHISLTGEGKKRAGKYQIDDLEIKKQWRWDKKWRILIFDIEDKQKIKREALRGKIKELGLFQLQKSVWVYPYDFTKEMTILRDFFGISQRGIRLITEAKIENDKEIKNFFNLK